MLCARMADTQDDRSSAPSLRQCCLRTHVSTEGKQRKNDHFAISPSKPGNFIGNGRLDWTINLECRLQNARRLIHSPSQHNSISLCIFVPSTPHHDITRRLAQRPLPVGHACRQCVALEAITPYWVKRTPSEGDMHAADRPAVLRSEGLACQRISVSRQTVSQIAHTPVPASHILAE